MSGLKEALRRGMALLGYEVHRTSNAKVSLVNFENLAQAYERRLNEADGLIAENSLRVKLLARLLGTPPSEAYFIVQALSRTRDVVGDVCEFGVAQGETSALIANEIRSSGVTFHLFDSFQGLPTPTEKDELRDDIFGLGSMASYKGAMSCPEDLVLSRLKAISFPDDRFVIHRGFVEDVLRTDRTLPERVRFAYLDFDLYQPTKVVLEFLHERGSVGSIVIVDDYDFFSTGVKSAVDEFIAEKNRDLPQYECSVPERLYGCFAVLVRSR